MPECRRNAVKYGDEKDEWLIVFYLKEQLLGAWMNVKQDLESFPKIIHRNRIGVKRRQLRKNRSYPIIKTGSLTTIQLTNVLRFGLDRIIQLRFIDQLIDISKLISKLSEAKREQNCKSNNRNVNIEEDSYNLKYHPLINLKNFHHDQYLNIYLLKPHLLESDMTTVPETNKPMNEHINPSSREDKTMKEQIIPSKIADKPMNEHINPSDREANIECGKLEVNSIFNKKEKLILKETVQDDKFLIETLVAGHFRDTNEIYGNKLYAKSIDIKSKLFSKDIDDDNTEYLMTVVGGKDISLQPVEITVFMQPGSHPHTVFGIPWNILNREINRILTFASYPIDARKSALLLANAGFVYIGSGQRSDDKVKCYFCCGEKGNWGILDVIHDIHRRISPHCPMVTGVNTDNDPLTTTSYSSCLVNPLNTSESKGELRSNIQTDSVLDVTQPSTDSRPHQCQPNKAPNNPREQTQDNTISRQNTTASSSASMNHPHCNTGYVMMPRSPEPIVETRSQTPGDDTNHTQTPRVDASHSQTLRNYLNVPTLAIPQLTHDSGDSTSFSVLASNLNESEFTTTPATAVQGATAAQVSIPVVQSSSLTSATNKPDANPSILNGHQSANNSPAGGQGSGSSNKPPTYSELGIITERPKRAEYARREARTATFVSWPRDHHLSPAELAEAGFYYAGYGDCARCFYCGGGLRNWEDEDDVWVEHARWFPKCAFIRQQRGQFFVDTVQELNKQYTIIPLEKVLSITGTSAIPTLATKNLEMKNDPAVITVQQLGYGVDDVLQAAQVVREELTIISSDAILERLDKDGKGKVNRGNIVLPAISSSLTADLEKIQRLKEKNNQLRQQIVCKICMDKEVAVVFLPCGHLVSCADCASAMNDCPYCRKPIKGIVRAFIS